MNRSLLTTCILTAVCYAQVAPRSLDVIEMDGGSVALDLGYNIIVNKDSSLHRKWYVMNDPSCPVRLSKTGVSIKHAGDRGFLFTSQGEVSATADVSAFEANDVLFDLWGDHLKTLSLVALHDLRTNNSMGLSDDHQWYASDNDVTEYLTSVTYVRNVRLADGKIWRADMRTILRKLGDIQLKVSEEKLDAKPPQDKK